MRVVLAAALLAACRKQEVPDSGPLDAPAPSTSATVAAIDAGPLPFHCFNFIHGMDSSTDCYRTPEGCNEARERILHGARPATPCTGRATASCTMLEQKEERCFDGPAYCERYRQYVRKNHLSTTPCEGR